MRRLLTGLQRLIGVVVYAAICLWSFEAHAVDEDEQKNTVVYNPVSDTFLVVWIEGPAKNQADIHGRLLNGAGAPLTADFAISTAGKKQLKPVAAYSAVSNVFLVVWLDHRDKNQSPDSPGIDIYGQLIQGDGSLAGSNFRISSGPKDEKRPAVAYASASDTFLVTWTDFRDSEESAADVYGQVVASDGELLGGDFPIAAGPENQFKPDVAYDSQSDKFLVVWQDRRNNATTGYDIFGQIVDVDGTLINQNFAISTEAPAEWRPVVANNPTDHTFMVVWMNRNGAAADLYGRVIDNDGAPLGGAFPVSLAEGGQVKPSIGYSPGRGVFLVAYMNCCTPDIDGSDIHGVYLSTDGSPAQDPIVISAAPRVQHRPNVAGSLNSFMVIWTDFRFGGDETVYEVFGRLVTPEASISLRLP